MNNRTDQLSREAYKRMLESEPFAVLQARITDLLNREEVSCVRADNIVDVRRAQGAIKALRTVLGLPAQIYSEMNK